VWLAPVDLNIETVDTIPTTTDAVVRPARFHFIQDNFSCAHFSGFDFVEHDFKASFNRCLDLIGPRTSGESVTRSRELFRCKVTGRGEDRS
jgi:hypothetical protein